MKKGNNLGKWMLVLIPLIIAGIQLWPTYQAWQMQSELEQLTPAEQVVWLEENGEAYAEAREKRLKLGLDLQGGMYVTMEVDVLKLLEESVSNDLQDDILFEVLNATATELETSEAEVLDVFLAKFDEIARPQNRELFSYFDFGNDADVEDAVIVENLTLRIDEAIKQAEEVMKQRVNKYGVSEPNIQVLGKRRLVLELPGVSNEEEVKKLIQTTAKLEFKLVRNNSDIAAAFKRIDDFLARETGVMEAESKEETPEVQADDSSASEAVESDAAGDSTDIAAADSSDAGEEEEPQKSDEEIISEYQEQHPFTILFGSYVDMGGGNQQIDYARNQFPDGDYDFYVPAENIQEVNDILARQEIRNLIPDEYDVLTEANPTDFGDGNMFYPMYGVKREAELGGDVITDARPTYDESQRPVVSMAMNDDGTEQWARITQANVDKRVAIVLDGSVYSAPNVLNPINNGQSQITGSGSLEEAELLAVVLKAGALKAPVQIIQETVVGPSLGADSISAGIRASMLGFGFVVLFMLLYYVKGGVISDIAVLINVVLIITLLSAFEGTLTLPGIAGLILTIGMAVDANILIFERIREERNRGKSLRAAIDEGFSKSLSAILDSNITTFLTAGVLWYFGSGPIQGFAVTLMIGIVMTVFTAVVVSRALFEIMANINEKGAEFNLG